MKRYLFILLILTNCSKSLPFKPDCEPQSIDDVREYMQSHRFIDCVEASQTADYLCRRLGYETMQVSLCLPCKDYGHRICIAWDRLGEYYCFSFTKFQNAESFMIETYDIETSLLSIFTKYDRIIIHKRRVK